MSMPVPNKAQVLLGTDTSHAEFWNLYKTPEEPSESAWKSALSTNSTSWSLEENRSLLRVNPSLDILSLECSKRRHPGSSESRRVDAASTRLPSTGVTLGREISRKHSVSGLKSQDGAHNTLLYLQYLRPVTPSVQEMDIWNRNPSVLRPSSPQGTQHRRQHGSQCVCHASAKAPLHDNQALSIPSRRSVKSDIRKLFSRRKPFVPITTSPAQTLQIPLTSSNHPNLQSDPVTPSIISGVTFPPSAGDRRSGRVMQAFSNDKLGDTAVYHSLYQASYQSSGDHRKIHVRRPPRGVKEWFDALSEDDADDDDDYDSSHKIELEKLQPNDQVPGQTLTEIKKIRNTSFTAEALEMLEAWDPSRKPIISPRDFLRRKSSDTLGTQERDSIIRNSMISSGNPRGERTSTSTKHSTDTKRSIRHRSSFQEGRSILALSDSDESDFRSVGVVCEVACANVTHAGRPKMLSAQQKRLYIPRPASHMTHDLSTTQCLVESEFPAFANQGWSTSAPTTVDPNTSARTSGNSYVLSGFPAESSPSDKANPPYCMPQTIILNNPPKQDIQDAIYHIGASTNQRRMTVTHEEAFFLANMRRKRAAVETQIFNADFKTGIEQELMKLEQLQAQALSTLELSREITEVQRMVNPVHTADLQESRDHSYAHYSPGPHRASSTGDATEFVVHNDLEQNPTSPSVRTAEFPAPPSSRPFPRSHDIAEPRSATHESANEIQTSSPFPSQSQLPARPSSAPARPSTDSTDPATEPNTPPPPPPPPPMPVIHATRLRKPKTRASYPYKLFPDTKTTTTTLSPRQLSMPVQHSLPTPDATPRASLSASVLALG